MIENTQTITASSTPSENVIAKLIKEKMLSGVDTLIDHQAKRMARAIGEELARVIARQTSIVLIPTGASEFKLEIYMDGSKLD